MTTSIFDRCHETAENEILKMREVAANIFKERRDIIIGVNGSVARREYTSGSDVDHFFLSTLAEEVNISSDETVFRAALEKQGLKMPSAGGVFEGAMRQDKLLSPIGGEDDTNKTLTRRMLFLLEGEWIFNKLDFDSLRKDLISQYVSDQLEDDKYALYLLNDIIRYWRTICIDFEFKTSGGKKARALRLAKLRMSRMLLCFAGIVAVAETNNLNPQAKRDRLVTLFSQQGIERLDLLLGERFHNAKMSYGAFLERLDNSDFRSKLALEGNAGMETSEYSEMMELARKFKDELVNILLHHYKADSPVVKSILL